MGPTSLSESIQSRSPSVIDPFSVARKILNCTIGCAACLCNAALSEPAPAPACFPLPCRVAGRYGGAYSSLQPRLSRTLLHTLLDPQRTLPQHYGAVKGIMALGPQAVSAHAMHGMGTAGAMDSRLCHGLHGITWRGLAVLEGALSAVE